MLQFRALAFVGFAAALIEEHASESYSSFALFWDDVLDGIVQHTRPTQRFFFGGIGGKGKVAFPQRAGNVTHLSTYHRLHAPDLDHMTVSSEAAGRKSPTVGKLKDLQWLHIPKTGTSFLSTIWNYACGGSSNGHLDLLVDPRYGNGVECRRSCYDFALMERYPKRTKCEYGVLHTDFHSMHEPPPKHWQWNVSLVGLFRRPNQRILSAFHHVVMHASGFTEDRLKDLQSTCQGKNASCFARYEGIAGCMTRMLTGGYCAEDPIQRRALGPPGSAPVAVRPGPGYKWRSSLKKQSSRFKIRKLQYINSTTGFLFKQEKEFLERSRKRVPFDAGLSRVHQAIENIGHMKFVGLTEEWDESVCLFHRMFGGTLNPAELKDFHRNSVRRSNEEDYDEAELQGFVDRADEQVYAAAQRRFWELHAANVPKGKTACQVIEEEGLLETATCHCGKRNAECGQIETPGQRCDCGDCPRSRLREFYRINSRPICNKKSNRCRIGDHEMHDIFSWPVNPCLFEKTCPSPRQLFPRKIKDAERRNKNSKKVVYTTLLSFDLDPL